MNKSGGGGLSHGSSGNPQNVQGFLEEPSNMNKSGGGGIKPWFFREPPKRTRVPGGT